MKTQLEDAVLTAVMPYIKSGSVEDIRMRIRLAMEPFDVHLAERAITVWDGNKNDITLKRFILAKIARGCSKRTVGYYNMVIVTALEVIGKNFDDITPDDIRLYLARRVQQDGVSKTTANNEYRCLSSFYGWLQDEEILLKNPMKKVDKIKETKKKKKAYDLLDIEKIRGACRTNRERALVECLSSTWARVSEIAGIRLTDIKSGVILVHGKGDKDREVFLNARAEYALEKYLAERRDNNPYLFPRCACAGDLGSMARGASKKSLPEWYKDPAKVDPALPSDVSSIESIVRNIGKRAGVENVHPHRFRRTGATMALRQGMPLITVSKILGHESVETTQLYLDISDEELAAAHNRYVI